MMSTKVLLALALPLSFSSVFAAVQVIPKAELDLKLTMKNESQFVLKSAKGTLLQASIMAEITPANWLNLSPADGAEGVRTEETYLTMGLPTGKDIIVAVVDSGVDVNHEDLQGHIWTNPGEIANNGIDDDKNGYIDDVFGWNFIGGANGMATVVKDASVANGARLVKGNHDAQVETDTLEITRELVRMKKLKAKVEELGETLSPAQADYLATIQEEITKNVDEAKKVVTNYTAYLARYKKNEEVLKGAGIQSISIEAVRALESTDPTVLKAKSDMLLLLSNNLSEARIKRILDAYSDRLNFEYNENFNPRTKVGDNYSDLSERIYGNNNVMGDDPHGTHVSGIIAATRDNAIGMKGVATNVKIMAVRVVPNGDERDKDVANGIRYAVDNGARIINMSFGKAFSPFKKVVDDAVKYAESKGVLMVHAAGNSNANNDTEPNFPNRMNKASKADLTNWLEIGASSFKKGPGLPATFSNYGKRSVDLFAPGVDILSTTPNNTYDTYSGTSMASPTAAGVAALILSYDASLSVDELRTLMLDTSRRYPKLKVNLPGTQDLVLFSSLSTTGTIVDALEAVKALK